MREGERERPGGGVHLQRSRRQPRGDRAAGDQAQAQLWRLKQGYARGACGSTATVLGIIDTFR